MNEHFAPDGGWTRWNSNGAYMPEESSKRRHLDERDQAIEEREKSGDGQQGKNDDSDQPIVVVPKK